MRRSIAFFLFVLAAVTLSAVNVGQLVTISVREAELRSNPGFLATVQTRLAYGDSVRVVEKRPGWVRVQAVETEMDGWLHESAVAPPADLRLSSTGRAGDTGASTREIALAGRGFNQQIEAEYQEQQQIDFTMVDEMEGFLQPTDELAAFLSAIGGSISDGGDQ